MPTTLITLHDVGVHYGQVRALSHIDLEIFSGEMLTIIGPNGAGKSTLIQLILGIQQPSVGTISYAPDLTMGYVPQKFQPSISLPLRVRDLFALQAAKTEFLQQIISHIDLAPLLDKSLHHLSGGERQRVLLARALLHRPQLLVLDEPMQGLDIHAEQDLYHYVQRLPALLGCAVVMVSHDLQWVMQGTERVICLNHHICCSGTPQQIQQQPEYQALFGYRLPYQHHHHQCEHEVGV